MHESLAAMGSTGGWTWRRLRAGEPDPERFFGVLCVPLALLAGGVVAMLPPGIVPPCPLRRVTGFPCPTCGTLRALRLMIGGEWAAALRMQPLVVALAGVGVLFSLYAWLVVLGRLPRLRPAAGQRIPWAAVGVTAAAVLALDWLYVAWIGPSAWRH